MLADMKIHYRGEAPFSSFLEEREFDVEGVTESVIKIIRFDELPIFIHGKSENLYFEVDLGSVKELSSEKLYFELLNLNTEILPVSVGIDTTNADDPRLVLVESREVSNLDENEFMSVISALELATDKVANILAEHV